MYILKLFKENGGKNMRAKVKTKRRNITDSTSNNNNSNDNTSSRNNIITIK